MTTAERDSRIIALRRQGLTMSQIADEVWCTRNAVISVLHRKAPELTDTTRLQPARTLDWRCDALHARMDAVLAETAEAIGRRYVPPERKH